MCCDETVVVGGFSLIVVHLGEYVSGGIATYLQTLITEQIANPKIDKIYLLISSYKSQKLSFTSDKVVVVPYNYKRNFFGIFKLLFLWHQIVAWHTDVVHLHSSFAGLMRARYLIARPSLRRRIKVIYCPHGWSFTREGSRWKRRGYVCLERTLALLKRVQIINISRSEQQIALENGFDAHQMTVVENAITYVPEAHRDKRPHSGKNFLFVGRFDWQKGLDVLLHAAALVDSDVHFKVVGAPVLEDEAVTRSYPSNVEAVGWLDPKKVGQMYQDIDALIVPSRWEGFGLVALEAMSHHTAVIASRVGGLQDIVVDGSTGLFFTPGDAAALAALLDTVTLSELAAMGNNGYRRLVENYNVKTMEQQIFDVYNK